jgi:membrane protein YdbS with pleckstrin-like domain
MRTFTAYQLAIVRCVAWILSSATTVSLIWFGFSPFWAFVGVTLFVTSSEVVSLVLLATAERLRKP